MGFFILLLTAIGSVTVVATSESPSEGDISPVPLRQSVVVAQDGTGNFTTISDAVAFIPDETPLSDGYNAIFIRAGVYKENVVVVKTKKNLIMIGAGVDRTVISGNRSAADGWSTSSSATFAVYGERFIAMNITFENTAGPEKHQAVAFLNSANLSSLYLCRFLGFQDTLYARSQLQFYRDCDIHGTVDFIFGDAASVFQHCTIIARRPLPGQYITITAQGRQKQSQATGIVIHNCTISAASDLKSTQGSVKSYLGRPWREYSRTVYMQSQIDGFIDPKGWIEWNNSGFALSTLFYGEFENNGTGANTSARVQWPGYTLMNRTQALAFTVGDFIAGDLWLPPIPYQLGLL